MPSVVRFLVALAILAALAGAAVYALATLVEPTEREMTIKVPQERFEAR